jgi:hypothetical protein
MNCAIISIAVSEDSGVTEREGLVCLVYRYGFIETKRI